jgi:hypothetical protein
MTLNCCSSTCADLIAVWVLDPVPHPRTLWLSNRHSSWNDNFESIKPYFTSMQYITSMVNWESRMGDLDRLRLLQKLSTRQLFGRRRSYLHKQLWRFLHLQRANALRNTFSVSLSGFWVSIDDRDRPGLGLRGWIQGEWLRLYTSRTPKSKDISRRRFCSSSRCGCDNALIYN